MEKIVLDTNILIQILKGDEKITSFLENLSANFCISSITAMEIFYGARDKRELKKLEKFIEIFEIIELNEQISKLSTRLIYQYSKSHNLAIPDALIASTCIHHNIGLFTLNLKDFRYIQDLKIFDEF